MTNRKLRRYHIDEFIRDLVNRKLERGRKQFWKYTHLKREKNTQSFLQHNQRDSFGSDGVLILDDRYLDILSSHIDLHFFQRGSVTVIYKVHVHLFRCAMCVDFIFMNDNANTSSYIHRALGE
ncbi:hypothetical protein CDAR_484601 [Caerostris darwini]|uniref:Uncharacterized protein n=1 Tax=Caerostris darwini TaxID=1538125 RepID=A0AAV4X4C9_9ARAC|nr:hypothetical protein CDAR_484601 [Caerostris darwini]